jgi:hypothetical protein
VNKHQLFGAQIIAIEGDDLRGIQAIRVVTDRGDVYVIYPHDSYAEDNQLLIELDSEAWRNDRGYPAVKP